MLSTLGIAKHKDWSCSSYALSHWGECGSTMRKAVKDPTHFRSSVRSFSSPRNVSRQALRTDVSCIIAVHY